MDARRKTDEFGSPLNIQIQCTQLKQLMSKRKKQTFIGLQLGCRNNVRKQSQSRSIKESETRQLKQISFNSLQFAQKRQSIQRKENSVTHFLKALPSSAPKVENFTKFNVMASRLLHAQSMAISSELVSDQSTKLLQSHQIISTPRKPKELSPIRLKHHYLNHIQ